MKTCKKCQKEKPLTEFHRNTTMKDGRRSVCRACRYAKPENSELAEAPRPERRACKKCRKEKPLTDFHRNKRMRDGRRNVCKLCRSPNPEQYRPQGSPLPDRKTCPKCKEVKPIADFTYSTGLRTSRCKECLKETAREERAANPEAQAARDRRYRERNGDKARAAGRRHYQANKAYYAAKNAEWIRENPVANRARRARYRARKLAAPGGGVSRIEWITLRDSYGCCIGCLRTDGPLEPDHVHPLSLGGRDHIDNIQPLCRSCNASKKNRCIDYRISFTSALLREPAFTTI
ncbi:HNH endonuclease [Streptomyces carpinensis]|uniref:HNH endonuclease n=1 Tax=Streptomyces carpinensis TaxID=66369 RepID=A0ABV1W0E8_9ACTN|nr:HNH endonuclease [Streptomyces carpinensis]